MMPVPTDVPTGSREGSPVTASATEGEGSSASSAPSTPTSLGWVDARTDLTLTDLLRAGGFVLAASPQAAAPQPVVPVPAQRVLDFDDEAVVAPVAAPVPAAKPRKVKRDRKGGARRPNTRSAMSKRRKTRAMARALDL